MQTSKNNVHLHSAGNRLLKATRSFAQNSVHRYSKQFATLLWLADNGVCFKPCLERNLCTSGHGHIAWTAALQGAGKGKSESFCHRVPSLEVMHGIAATEASAGPCVFLARQVTLVLALLVLPFTFPVKREHCKTRLHKKTHPLVT